MCQKVTKFKGAEYFRKALYHAALWSSPSSICLGSLHMPFDQHQTCLLIFFFKQWLFFWPLFCKTQLWSVLLKVVLWTDTPISAVEFCSSFRVNFGLFVASLINALLAWSVSFGGWPSRQVCWGAIFLNVFNNGFNGAPWDVHSLGYFLITHP